MLDEGSQTKVVHYMCDSIYIKLKHSPHQSMVTEVRIIVHFDERYWQSGHGKEPSEKLKKFSVLISVVVTTNIYMCENSLSCILKINALLWM